MRNLATELNRTVLSRGFLGAVTGIVLVLCIGAYDIFKELFTAGAGLAAGVHTAALLTGMTSDLMLMALPVLSALPGTAGFVEDWKSGYIKACLPRQGRRAYIVSKAAAAALSGALAVAAGVASAYVVFLIAFLPSEAPALAGAPSMAPDVLAKACMLALCGALWPLIGLACSAPTLSAHMAYASPFILYYLLVITVARYFPGAAVLSPQEWLRPGHVWPGGNWGIALFIAELGTAAALCFGAAAARRLRND
jgi:hypothetical protein